MDDLSSFKDAWSIAVALAWEDDAFRTLLLSDPLAAFASDSINYLPPGRIQIVVIEEGSPSLNAALEPDKDAILVTVLPRKPDDLKKGASELAEYLRRIDPPKNISCLC